MSYGAPIGQAQAGSIIGRDIIDAQRGMISNASISSGQLKYAPPSHSFTCVQAVNGWILHYNNEQYICADLEALGQQVLGVILAQRLEKK